MTDGLTHRLQFPSLQSMRAAAVRSPHGLVQLFLEAGHRAGLPQSWAEQFAAWTRGEIDRLWASQPLPLNEARRRALVAETRENQAEQEALIAGDTIATLEAERDAVELEIAADLSRVRSLTARIERLREFSGTAA